MGKNDEMNLYFVSGRRLVQSVSPQPASGCDKAENCFVSGETREKAFLWPPPGRREGSCSPQNSSSVSGGFSEEMAKQVWRGRVMKAN